MEKVIEMIEAKGMEKQVSISSFEVDLLKAHNTDTHFAGIQQVYKFNKYDYEGIYDDLPNHEYVNGFPGDTIVVSSAVLRSSLIR